MRKIVNCVKAGDSPRLSHAASAGVEDATPITTKRPPQPTLNGQISTFFSIIQ